MALDDTALAANHITLIERALRSLDVAAVIEPVARVRAVRPRKERAPRSLRSALRALLGADGTARSDQRLQLVLGRLGDAMLEGIVVFARGGRIAYANDNLARMLGRAPGELVDQPAGEPFGEIYKRARDAAPRAGRAHPAERFETELRTKEGGTIVVEVCGERIHARDGTLLGALAVMIDITARANALRHSESEVRLLSAQFMAAQELE